MTEFRPVFIRGSGRCASTLLIDQLGGHPDLAQVELDEVLPECLIEFSRWQVQHAAPSDEAAIIEACLAYFSAYCDASAGRARMHVHKATMSAHLLETLLDWWPEARVIYLVRHPLDVVTSLINVDIHRFRGRFGYTATVANSLLRWFNEVSAYVNSRAFDHERVMQVRYEDLFADFPETTAAIHRFLGVTPRPASPVTPRETYDRPFRLNVRERTWILKSTRDLCAALGYDRHHEAEERTEIANSNDEQHPERRLRAIPPAVDALELVRLAMQRASISGHRRIGLFGAGQFARIIAGRLHTLDPKPVCLFDDDPMLLGRALDGLTVHRPEAAPSLGLDVVVPLTFVHQRTMIAQWRRRIGSDVPIIILWDEMNETSKAASTIELTGVSA